MTKVFQGKKLALKLEKEIKKKVGDLQKKFGLTPKLASIVIGGDRAFRLYLSLQEKAAKRVGILLEKEAFSPQTDQKQIGQYINSLNRDEKVHGIVIQMPLPEKFDPLELAGQIKLGKDVDCLNPENLKRLTEGRSIFLPAVMKAVMKILHLRGEWLKGKKVVVVGASGFVGRPLVAHLKNFGLEVIPCDEFTKNLKKWTKRGDVLISATGAPGLIKKEMVKKEAVVIDVGSPEGDVDFEEVKKVVSFITPVPGGVGPITIACLLENVLLATKRLINGD